MNATQIVAVTAAAGVALLYIVPLVRGLFVGPKDPVLLTHLRNVIAVREAYKTPKVTDACNALMEALLDIQ